MVIETVFVLVLWNAIGSAKGDIFPQSKMVSSHLTEQECEKSLKGALKVKSEGLPLLSCVKASKTK